MKLVVSIKKIPKVSFDFLYFTWHKFQFHFTNHLNSFNLPLKGGYFIEGSSQVGVFMIDFL